ncbi:MAG: amidohydrolase family protein [Planctomycetota bacterium]
MENMQLLVDADVHAPRHLGRRSLLLGGGRVLWMGEEPPALSDRLGVEVTDLGGLRLVPGFVDGHAHVTGGGGETGYGSSVPPQSVDVFLRAGVTSVVGVLGTDDCVRTTGQLVHAVYGLRAHGLAAWCHTGGYHVPPTTLTGSVRRDICHVDPIIGFGELAISDHRSSQPTFDEFLRLASEVHVGGLMTGKAGVLHLHLGDGKRGLELVRRALDLHEIPARTFHPTHVNRRRALLEEAIAATERGVTIDVTASPEDGSPIADGPDADLPASYAVERILASGAPRERFTISSDGGGCLPTFDEDGELVHVDVGRPDTLPALLARLLDRGVALEDALLGLTSNPATLLRLEGRGCVEVGAHADLVVLEHGTHAVRDVWCGGVRRVADGVLRRGDPFGGGIAAR